jgi:glucose-6-phosphate isomerase
MRLALFNEAAGAERHFERFLEERVLRRLRALTVRAQRDGLESLRADDEPLIALGMELDRSGRVVRNGYGVFDLAWQAAVLPEWPDQVVSEVTEIRSHLKAAHGVPLRYLIWAGMGGSMEDKSAYAAAGLLRGRIHFYALDSTDPAKLRAILDDIERRSRRPLREALRSTLVVGMALGMTSYEPVVNLERLTRLFERSGIDSRSNFLYVTLPGSILDQFAAPRAYRRVPLQLDGRHTTSGRHSSPLTRGSLLPLALAGADLREWIRATALTDDEVMTAWRLASFLHAAGLAGRDKVTLRLRRAWRGAALWTKQAVEESLGKSEALGIKIVIDEKPGVARYRAAADPAQDRAFLAVRSPGDAGDGADALRRRGYPVATLQMPSRTPLSGYMQTVHHTVFGLAYLRDMNFVTQPSVELYKSIAAEIYAEAQRAGDITRTSAWREMSASPRQAAWHGRMTLYFGDLDVPEDCRSNIAPQIYAQLLRALAAERRVEYGELTFFGDLRYGPAGRRMRTVLEAAAGIFRRALSMPADVYEGPAMNHSYHEMIIGHGRCFSTILMSRAHDEIKAIGCDAGYHTAQFLATRIALARRKRPVVAILLKDLSDASLATAGEFFRSAATHLRRS